MLTAPTLRWRVLTSPRSLCRVIINRHKSGSSKNGIIQPAEEKSAGFQDGRPRESRDGYKGRVRDDQGIIKTATAKKPTLIEQLFPEESKQYEESLRQAPREVPRLPFEKAPPEGIRDRHLESSDVLPAQSPAASRLIKQLKKQDEQDPQITVLVLRNASKNLLEDDFRRLVPKGQHVEGWSLGHGQFLKVVPGRDLATLEQQNWYYLLFSHSLSAFTYQSHVSRIARLASEQTPSSLMSPIPAPPGLIIDGMDVQETLQTYALLPASQKLELRQLRPPLSPLVHDIIRHKGYSALTRRKDKMPYEVRLTLEGPQLNLAKIRHILLSTANHRSLAWSGGDELVPKISKWEPKANLSPHERETSLAMSKEYTSRLTEEELTAWKQKKRIREEGRETKAADVTMKEQRHVPTRELAPVYILGFYTELAAQQFVQHWRRRPMIIGRGEEEKEWEGDLPPVAIVELLW
jgi:hypothetical protein